MRHSLLTAAASLLVALVFLAGCSEDATMKIDDMWARPTAPAATTAAFYGEIKNTTIHDELLEANSPLCDEIELHRSVLTDGVMSMRPAEQWEFEVLHDHTLELEPGGLHLMCIGLSEPLVAGETTALDLNFLNFGTVTVDVDIEDRE